MKTIEYTFRDKSEWGDGPWQTEPDKIQWLDEETGLPCLIVRGPLGALCGYVGISEGHPYFEKDYNDADVEVHGGLTFADFCAPGNKEHGICHVVEAGENDRVWWFGFDCAHSCDLVPQIKKYGRDYYSPHDQYRDIAYVRGQITRLAWQLKAMAA